MSKTDKNWRRVAEFVDKGRPSDGSDSDGPPALYSKKIRNQFGDKYGVKARSIFLGLPGISFPWSFPPDAMHLFYENVVPRVVKHYRGVYFLGADADAADAASCAPIIPSAGDGDDLDRGMADTRNEAIEGRQRDSRSRKRGRRVDGEADDNYEVEERHPQVGGKMHQATCM